ncbi:radical SAM protein [Achromobacter seleniivolatilans]|uniref:Radical SAM protein n=1 Tax=Achromobacter seleniivolatilans TaxID=3047478 RepID=A0ABY9M6N5_9BURK|nr:radical SAM protein [Achromobacter sp. R39]WMD22350.1 radical SAM protein [Achromobacter sp. R39]
MDQRISAPLHIDFAITGRCQLRCDYCSAMPLGQPDVPVARAIEILKEMRDIGVFSLLLSGGEPTVHRDFLKIAAAASDAIPSLLINTNGLRLAKSAAAAELRTAAPAAIVAISLDSPNLESNDVSRGFGGEHAVQAIENCLREGIVVCISAVLTEATVGSATGLVDRFFPSVKKYRFFPRVLRSCADAQRNGNSYAEAVKSFYESLGRLATRYPGVELLTPMGNSARYDLAPEADMGQRCICAQTRLYIDSSLDVFPCYYAANDHNKLGSCVNKSLKEIWTSRVADSLRKRATHANLCGPTTSLQAIPARYRSFNIERAV